jgi:hypothetical protein
LEIENSMKYGQRRKDCTIKVNSYDGNQKGAVTARHHWIRPGVTFASGTQAQTLGSSVHMAVGSSRITCSRGKNHHAAVQHGEWDETY